MEKWTSETFTARVPIDVSQLCQLFAHCYFLFSWSTLKLQIAKSFTQIGIPQTLQTGQFGHFLVKGSKLRYKSYLGLRPKSLLLTWNLKHRKANTSLNTAVEILRQDSLSHLSAFTRSGVQTPDVLCLKSFLSRLNTPNWCSNLPSLH